MEVLVIDQSVDKKTSEVVLAFDQEFPTLKNRVRYFYQEEKCLVKARNRGLSEASGEVVSFIDDDASLFSDYFEKVIGFFSQNKDVGGISGRQILNNPPRDIKWTFRTAILSSFLLSFNDGRMTASGFGYPITYEKEIDRVIFVEMLPGCNMNFRKSVIGQERFDEWFSGYGFREDADFSYRISTKSLCVMIPDAKLHHRYSPVNRLNIQQLKRMEIGNHYYVFKKYKQKNTLSYLLFFYSLGGIFLIDLLELLFRPSVYCVKKLFANFPAVTAIAFRARQ